MFWKKKPETPELPKHLPNSEGDDSLIIRDPEIVAKRFLALLAVVGRTHEEPPTKVNEWLETNRIAQFLSPSEKSYFYSENPEFEVKRDFSWKAETAVSLLWALGGIDKFPNLNEQFDIYTSEMTSNAINEPAKFVESASLQDSKKLEEHEQHLYNQHWRVRDAQLFNKEMPAELDPGIVYERRYGLSWVVGWGEEWDDVPTDT